MRGRKLNVECWEKTVQATAYLNAAMQFEQKQSKAECEREAIREARSEFWGDRITKSEHVIDKSCPPTDITRS